jgi:hypothetical protein
MPPPGDGTSLNTIERCGLEIRYVRVTSGPQRNRYVHHLVMEAMLGRRLLPGEEVDHIDGNTLNNDYTNLQLMTASEHAKKTRRQAVEKASARRRERDRTETHGEDVPF